MLFLHFTGGCGGYDGHHQGVPFQSCHDGALTNGFSYPPYDLFAHRLFAMIVKDLSLKNTPSAAGWARGGRRRRGWSGGLI